MTIDRYTAGIRLLALLVLEFLEAHEHSLDTSVTPKTEPVTTYEPTA